MMIWPARRLQDSKRYIVAMRGLQTTAGLPVRSSAAFAALRDSVATDDPDVESRRAHFNSSVFPVLAAAGVARSTLQLAWDFTVMSTHTQTGRLLSMREDALKRVASGIKYTIFSSEDSPSASIARTIKGRMIVPWYLTQVRVLDFD